MLILGFGSKARQGKDSAAHAIQQYYLHRNNGFGNPTVGIYKFATALYQEVNEALENKIWNHRTITRWWPFKQIELPDWVQPDPNPEISELAPYGKHPKLLQWWGSDFRRKLQYNYWVSKLFDSIPSTLDIVLITDVRFPNEAEAIKERGGYLVNVERLNEDGSRFVSEDRPADHPSETALDDWNWDAHIRSKSPELTGSLALTTCDYFKRLNENKR